MTTNKTLTSEAQITNQKDLTPGQKIAQTSTQKAKFPSPESTQFPITESNLMIKKVDSHGRTISSKMNSSPNLNRGWPNLPNDFFLI